MNERPTPKPSLDDELHRLIRLGRDREAAALAADHRQQVTLGGDPTDLRQPGISSETVEA